MRTRGGFDENTLDIEADYQLGHDAAIPPGPGAGASASVGGLGPPVDLVFANFRRGTAATVTLWADAPGVLANVTTLVGNTRSTRTFTVGTQPRSLRVFGAFIGVTMQNAAANTQHTIGHAQLTAEDSNPLGEWWLTWLPQLLALGRFGVPIGAGGATPPVTAQGTLIYASGTVVSLDPGDPVTGLYLQFFDANGPGIPANGSVPLISIGPLVAGTPFSLDFSARPCVFFLQGLEWALSTTDDVLTAAGAAATARVDVGVGQ